MITNIKIPRRLYSTSEINKFFSLNGQSIRNIWCKDHGTCEVEADNGKKYIATYTSKYMKSGFLNSFVELKLKK